MSDGDVNTRRLNRIEAERLIANAYRIPQEDTNGNKSGDNAPLAGNSSTKLRTLTRLPTRAVTPLGTSFNEFYLQQSGVQFYVDDLVQQLQDKRPDQPALFIANYFTAVIKGTNVKGRPFEYINGCLQNRIAFLSQLQRSYGKIDHNMLLSVGDFTEMLWCQCRDLPVQLVKQATCHLPEGEDGQRRASLRILLAAFSACFFFNEFLNKMFDIYNDISTSKDNPISSPHSSRSESSGISNANTFPTDRVIARLRVVAQQNTSVVGTDSFFIGTSDSTTFNAFCH
ncbi:hypothetical protein BBO99_00001165 [Phytophthora kernoviae]|uniref:Centriolar satellite-associated tubulin polyglutamylase complex regulator 1 n=2 Tax=Phytophthora kernoviae TaxID=325452 RepID=A0A3R7KY87_9STRA|nr:hypothetical protein G195_005134 [Phytophthora kernoviae 00238/432]KAG2529619.1 hypothetical protein JM18_001396 [Phytophthora kernoviae]KAG2531166.1 hypothetical protein JM16_001260 [Phytophthora kernoviae]RLN26623.1 hypothetical protein BBI17_004070 [Phytophthora kernoviae]RLN84662.1 hypothetical protein BBO99_00001165 [Phytophthora kernoviae]